MVVVTVEPLVDDGLFTVAAQGAPRRHAAILTLPKGTEIIIK